MKSLGFSADGSEQHIGEDLDGNIVLKTTYADASDVLDRNAQLRLVGHTGSSEMRLAASIPMSLVHKWRVEHGVDVFSSDPEHKRKARALLNSNEYYRIRIWGGNI